MRLRSRVPLLIATLVIAAGAPPLWAEPIDVTIPITSGSGSFYPNAGAGASPLQLYGDGFSLNVGPEFGATSLGCCLLPGATAHFTATWTGNDLIGTATYNGQTFSDVGSLASTNVAGVHFVSDSFTVPTFDGSTAITVTVPFTFDGYFRGHPGGGLAPATVNATLVGSGIGTIPLTWLPGAISTWQTRIVFLQFGATDAVPEPSSIILICLSLAGMFVASRYRRFASH